MALLQLQSIHVAFGGPPLLDGVNLQLQRGERVCLVGRNGEGKTTLLRILMGDLQPDTGTVTRAQSVRVAQLEQTVPDSIAGTVHDVVAAEANDPTETHEIDRVLSQLELPPHAEFATLSGGMQRRTLLARALIHQPDVLILDEPTNHLDIESIQWLENWLLRWNGTLLFVTHDRVFLQRLATRIIELDRGQLTSWDCDYATFLVRREALLDAEQQAWDTFDKKLAQEEQWIRQGIKARRTRNEGRVRELEQMRIQRAQRRERSQRITMGLNMAERTGEKVIRAQGVTHQFGDTPCIQDFTADIDRGSHIGIIGPNGCGKTTLLNILLGRLTPQEGQVIHGTRLNVAYFDQHRQLINPKQSVKYNLCREDEYIHTAAGRQHVIGYLQQFLFSPADAMQPAGSLSGGERNRLMLARLFSRPSNVLVLDEPTNDLDIETLDLLEELVADYPGTVLVVSHDRAFLNHVVTDILAFEPGGRIGQYAGGYDDWLRQRPATQSGSRASNPSTTAVPRSRKKTNKERAELRDLPKTIEALEAELNALQEQVADPAFYQADKAIIQVATERLETLPKLIETAYARWAELESF